MGAEVVRIVQREGDDRVAGVGKVVEAGGAAVIGVAGEGEFDEHAVVVVDAGVAERLAVDRHDALTFLAGALGDELLDPGADGPEGSGGDEGELVAAFPGKCSKRHADGDGWVGADRGVGGGGLAGGDGAVEERLKIDAGEGGRDEAEKGEGGVAAADVGRVEEDAGVGVVLREGGQAGSGVGDGDEVASGRVRAGAGVARPEVFGERCGFQGAAGLAGDDED